MRDVMSTAIQLTSRSPPLCSLVHTRSPPGRPGRRAPWGIPPAVGTVAGIPQVGFPVTLGGACVQGGRGRGARGAF